MDKIVQNHYVDELYTYIHIQQMPASAPRHAPFTCSPDTGLGYTLRFITKDGHTINGFIGANRLCGGVTLQGGALHPFDDTFLSLVQHAVGETIIGP